MAILVPTPIRIFAGRRRLSAALAALSLLAATGAHAATATTLTAVDRLVAEDAIRQQIILYGLLADGDGKSPQDIRALATRVLAPEIVTDIHDGQGKIILHSTGRQAVIDSTPQRPTDGPTTLRHNFVSTYFDALTPTTASTRTTVLFVVVSKQAVGCSPKAASECPVAIPSAGVFIFHDSWKKTADGWLKTHAEIYPGK